MLEGPPIESQWGRDFSHLSRPALRPTQPPIKWVPFLFSGVKAARLWVCPPTPSSTNVKERVELYLYSPSGLSWPVIVWPLHLLLRRFLIFYIFMTYENYSVNIAFIFFLLNLITFLTLVTKEINLFSHDIFHCKLADYQHYRCVWMLIYCPPLQKISP